MDEILALLRRVVTGAWRRRWLALAVAWGVCLAGWIFIATLPPRYESSAQLYVAADPVLKPLLDGIAINGTSDAEFDLLRQTLLSRPNLVTLIDKTGLGLTVKGPAARDALMNSLASRVRIEPQTNNLFTIAFESRSPQRAVKVVQTLVDIYIERASVHNQSDMNNARTFLDSQIAYFKQQLQDVEQRRADFLAKYLLLLPGANGVSQLGSERALVRSLEGNLQDVKAEQSLMEKELAKTPPMLTAQQIGAAANPQLVAAEERLAELKQRFTDAYPGVIDQKKIIAMLKAGGGVSGTTVVMGRSVANPTYEQLKVRLINAKSTIFSLKRQLKSALVERAKLTALARSEPGLQAQYTNLDRNYGILLQKYNDLLSRRESMRIGAAANIDANEIQLQVVNPPQYPRAPMPQHRSVLFAAVLVLGVAAGAALAVLLSEIEGCFYTVGDLRNIGLPVLGGISQLHAASQRLRPLITFGAAILMLILVCGGFVAGAKLLQRLA
jgi:polysaccharide chain length determinant protein (PEP-CTERM system associated)